MGGVVLEGQIPGRLLAHFRPVEIRSNASNV
jgi:hypothetical protein